jgi:DNA replication protein DnaC
MSKEPPTLLLEHHLKALKLSTILREYAAVAATCRQERCDYATFLLRLTERELIDRERRATERRIRDAQFQVVKTLDTFDFAAQPSINEALVRELIRGEYIHKRENVLLVGNPGTGKTHLAIALGFAACGQGKTGALYHRHRPGDPAPRIPGKPQPPAADPAASKARGAHPR